MVKSLECFRQINCVYSARLLVPLLQAKHVTASKTVWLRGIAHVSQHLRLVQRWCISQQLQISRGCPLYINQLFIISPSYHLCPSVHCSLLYQQAWMSSLESTWVLCAHNISRSIHVCYILLYSETRCRQTEPFWETQNSVPCEHDNTIPSR